MTSLYDARDLLDAEALEHVQRCWELLVHEGLLSAEVLSKQPAPQPSAMQSSGLAPVLAHKAAVPLSVVPPVAQPVAQPVTEMEDFVDTQSSESATVASEDS